jgi:hypothetical protein
LRIDNLKALENIEKNSIFDIILYVMDDEEYYNLNNNADNRRQVFFTVDRKEIDRQIEGVFTRMLELLEGTKDSDDIKA